MQNLATQKNSSELGPEIESQIKEISDSTIYGMDTIPLIKVDETCFCYIIRLFVVLCYSKM